MRYCSTCLYPAPCGRCEDSDNSSARITVDVREYCPACDQWCLEAGPWCQLYDLGGPSDTACIFREDDRD